MNRWKLYLSALILFCLGIIIYSEYSEKVQEFTLFSNVKVVHETKESFLQQLKIGSVFSVLNKETQQCDIYKLEEYVGGEKYKLSKVTLLESTFIDVFHMMLALNDEVNFQADVIM